jgi:hypothetical protein
MEPLHLSDDSPVFQCDHMLELDEPVQTSTGPTTTYWDGIGACLCRQCIPYIRDYFEAALLADGNRLWPVATGASGALILGLLGPGSYLSARGKVNGPSWRNLAAAQQSLAVALLDDCIFSGATFDYLRAACADAGLVVAREVVLLDGRQGRQMTKFT